MVVITHGKDSCCSAVWGENYSGIHIWTVLGCSDLLQSAGGTRDAIFGNLGVYMYVCVNLFSFLVRCVMCGIRAHARVRVCILFCARTEGTRVQDQILSQVSFVLAFATRKNMPPMCTCYYFLVCTCHDVSYLRFHS